MIEIAGLVVAGVAALGTMVQAYYSAKAANKRISKASIKKAEKRAKSPLKIGAKKVSEVIDKKLLETLQLKIEEHNKALIKAFKDSEISDSERKKIVEAARIQICSFLTEVKKFNKGKLPTKRLINLWSSNNCRSKI